MAVTKISITWRGRTLEADRRITFTDDSWYLDHRAVLEMLYRDTNLYEGPLWDVIEPLLPADRSHTAISVGDLVEIDESGLPLRTGRLVVHRRSGGAGGTLNIRARGGLGSTDGLLLSFGLGSSRECRRITV